MDAAETQRKLCLKRQTELRSMLIDSQQHDGAMKLFLSQHAALHSRRMAQTEPWSFEDEILTDMPEEQARRTPAGFDHSIAWLIWHISRCEDIAMNLLVAGTPQILSQGHWLKRTNSPVCDTGNAMDRAALKRFNSTIDMQALRAYRVAVGRRTREIVKHLQPADLRRKVSPSSIQTVMDEGGVVDAARGIADYWSRRNVAGLMLMPATRHNLIHLTEAARIKRGFHQVV